MRTARRLATLPNLDRRVHAARYDVRVRFMHIERRAEVLVRVEGLHTTLIAQVPDAQRFVIAGGNHVLAARMEHDAPDPVVVAGEREQTQPGADVPNPNRLISRSRR